MNTRNRTKFVSTLAAAAMAAIVLTATAASAATYFSDGFNANPGDQNATQLTTTLAVQFNANYANWGITAGPAGHQVDLNPANAAMISGNPENLPNPNNWGAMLLANQVILSNSSFAANNNGQQYTVDFVAGPAVYAAGGQQSATANGNGL